MSSKGIKIAAWISIAINILALVGMADDASAPDTGIGIVYVVGMGVVSVVALFGAHEWDAQTEAAVTRERNLREKLK